METRNLLMTLTAAAFAAATLAGGDAILGDGKNLHPHPVEVGNAGFEEGKAGWEIPANGAIDTSVAHSGKASASLTVEDPDRDVVYITRKIPVEGGAVYLARCYVKARGVKAAGTRESVGVGLIVDWADRDGKWLTGSHYDCNRFGTRDWELSELKNLRAPRMAGYAWVCLALRGAGKAWFDDFSLTAMEAAVGLKEPAADATIACNTPLFTWEELWHTGDYTLELSKDRSFPAGATRAYAAPGVTSFRVKEPLEPGVWHWRVRAPGANHAEPRTFTQTAPKGRDCLPPDIRASAKRVLAADGAFTVPVWEDGLKAPRVTFGDVKGTCGRRDRDGVRTVTFKAPAGGWAKGLTEGEITATDAAGNVATRPFWLLNAPKPANDVVVDAVGNFVEAGRRIFPLGIYEVWPKDFREVRDAGFDVVHAYRWEGTQDDSPIVEYLDACWKTDGLRAFIGFDRGNETKNGLRQGNFGHLARRTAALAGHPGLFCWYLFDEPEHAHQHVPAAKLIECADFVRALDPYHPVVMTTQGPAMIDYRRSWDTHWTQAYGDPAGVVRQIDEHRGFLKNDSPITALLNCNDIRQTQAIERARESDGELPKPDTAKFGRDYDHLRACAFLSVAMECNGAFWWWFARDSKLAYSASQCPPAWANLVKVVKELGALRPLITAPGRVETGREVDGDSKVLWWRKTLKGGGSVFIAVNTGNAPATVTIKGRRLTFRRHEVKVEK